MLVEITTEECLAKRPADHLQPARAQVDDRGNGFDVDPLSGDPLEIAQETVAAPGERLRELVDFGARTAEDDRRGRVLHVEHASERCNLVATLDDVCNLARAG